MALPGARYAVAMRDRDTYPPRMGWLIFAGAVILGILWLLGFERGYLTGRA